MHWCGKRSVASTASRLSSAKFARNDSLCLLELAGQQQHHQHQQQLLQQQAMLMQRMLSSGMAGPSGQDHQALANNNALQPGMYAGQLHGRPLGTMSHGQALVPSGSQAYLGVSSEVEAVLKDAHEAYRSGEYTRALQFCHAVRTIHILKPAGPRCCWFFQPLECQL